LVQFACTASKSMIYKQIKWWPETGSNRRRRLFLGLPPMVLSGLESAEMIDVKKVKLADA
jgi:hypothetical protein